MWRRSATSASGVISSVQLLSLLLLYQHLLGALSLPSKMSYTPPPPLSISLSSVSVDLGDSVTIRCHINSNLEGGTLMAQSSMTLYCPATPRDTFCFQNCRPQEVCNGNGGCRVIPALEGVTCRSIIHPSGEIVYEYTLDRVTSEWVNSQHPGFACHSAAGKTDWSKLRVKTQDPLGAERTITTPPPPPKITTTSTTTATTTTTMATTTTPKPSKTTASHGATTNGTKAVIISSSNTGDDSVQWLNFLRNSSSDKRKLKGVDTFGGQSDFKPTGVIPTVAWYPADPRMLPAGSLTQQMTPSSAFRRSVVIPDESLVENPPLWNPFESANSARSHPEGKAANGSTMSNSAGRNSDSGFSIAQAGSPQPIQILPNTAAYPISFEPLGWSGPVTPRPKYHAHRLRHQFVPSYYVGVKRASSRETVFSERPMSEIGFEPTSHNQHHYIPVVLGPGGGVRASQPQLASVSAYGAPLCSPADVSLIEKPGAGDGASAGGGSGSPKPGMAVLLPAAVISHQFGVVPPPSSSTERSSVPLLKAELAVKSKAMTPEATLEEVAVVNEATGKSAAEVRMWLQSMPSADKDNQSRMPTKLADSLNTDYDVPSDWSEREPMLMREKPSSEETGPTE
ncbi:unnamed protein product [Taenia asiatica]|uniref:Ig-like domain-containing protein n=1 Tax=Taenia asiatica TaxID=60517 RepID=A0A158R9Z2_TAEAS|nr:unnamed protein product [Taenia asiatica]